MNIEHFLRVDTGMNWKCKINILQIKILAGMDYQVLYNKKSGV